MMKPATPDGRTADVDRILTPLNTEESLELLGSVAMGRVVFTDRALPAIRPVNHIVDAGDVIIRSSIGTQFAAALRAGDHHAVVAYEADSIDPVARVGWSVVITGLALLVSDARQIRYYERRVHPWVEGPMDCVVRIQPHIVTGFRLIDPDA
jgi:nitroimidazol reductase NimA-like FMN-containing flavoprotein (pyridoxamine 5'-phosphate oxidase superfamily)